MPNLFLYSGGLTFPLLVLAWCLWWPRVHYESANPNMNGEDYWIPGFPHVGPKFSRGPDLLFFLHLDDHRLKKRIARRLGAEEFRNIVIRVRQGHAHLYGYVAESALKMQAASLAAAVTGVDGVRNELAVQLNSHWLNSPVG